MDSLLARTTAARAALADSMAGNLASAARCLLGMDMVRAARRQVIRAAANRPAPAAVLMAALARMAEQPMAARCLSLLSAVRAVAAAPANPAWAAAAGAAPF